MRDILKRIVGLRIVEAKKNVKKCQKVKWADQMNLKFGNLQ
jgi:hypothetical protein